MLPFVCSSEERHALVDSCRSLSTDLRCLNKNDRCLNALRSFKMSFKGQYFEPIHAHSGDLVGLYTDGLIHRLKIMAATVL